MIYLFQISNPQLMDLIGSRIRLNKPYVGVFLKKDDELVLGWLKELFENSRNFQINFVRGTDARKPNDIFFNN